MFARAVAASNAREDVRGYSPQQDALGRAPDLDGRFYTPEHESLPTIQAELVDETYGNNIKRMQNSEVNFLRWTYQNRVSRALNSKNRKAQVSLPGTYVYYWRKDRRETKGSFNGIARVLCTETRRDNEQEGSAGQLPLLPGAPRPGGCVLLSRAGRLIKTDDHLELELCVSASETFPVEESELLHAWQSEFPATRSAIVRSPTNMVQPQNSTLANIASDAGGADELARCATHYRCLCADVCLVPVFAVTSGMHHLDEIYQQFRVPQQSTEVSLDENINSHFGGRRGSLKK